MKSNINHSPFRTFQSIADYWKRGNIYKFTTVNYPDAKSETHYADGWRDVVIPALGENQRYGELFYDAVNDVVTREVLDIPAEEVAERKRNQLLSEAEMKREEILQQKIKDDALNYFQALPAEDALQNKEVYPMWSDDVKWVEAENKYLHWLKDELVLWEVVQAHGPQPDWQPQSTPALWKRVALPDQILAWSQPFGANDSYQIGDKVTHNGSTWESTSANNVWEPGVYGWKKL